MSWDADLFLDGEVLRCWNYTHNTNFMANEVLFPPDEKNRSWDEDSWTTWWKTLDGMDGLTSALFLGRIIKGLENDHDHFRVSNPQNGWGDFDSFLKTLCDMRDVIPEAPVQWRTYG